ARGGYYQRVYRFIGLTRRDPTLRIDDDVGDQEARIDVSVSDLPTNDEGDLSVSVRSPIDFYFAGDEEGSQGTVAIDYDGEDPFPSTLRALFWNDSGIASEFYGLASKSFALNDSEITDVVLDSWEPLSSTGQLSG